MITILYHARTNGGVCRRIARAAPEGTIIEVLCDKDPLPPRIEGMLVRWDSKMELGADSTINSAQAVKVSRNKKLSRVLLDGLCPSTWTKVAECRYPCVVRPKRHYGGMHFHVCRNVEELRRAIRPYRPKGWYATQLINKTQEYRVFVLRGEAFKVVRRFVEGGDPATPWNAHAGGRARRVKQENWPTEVVARAEAAANVLTLDLCAVDVIVDKQQAYVLEANTAPGIQREGTAKKIAKLLVAACG